jgi:hypothetical protein
MPLSTPTKIIFTPLTLIALVVIGLFAASSFAASATDSQESPWISETAQGARIKLHFFWTVNCPHCQAARPFVSTLEQRYPWLQVVSSQLDDDPEQARRYVDLAKRIGENAYSVPAFLFCGDLLTGFDTPATTGRALETALTNCYQTVSEGQRPWLKPLPDRAESVSAALPILGERDLESWSLPLVTVVLAALDSFNPCAFFVLLFLLSLLVNARSRKRMLLVGGLFVSVSGLVYFAFMAAWLNVFLLFGELRWVTLAAGLLAVTFGAMNLKDYFFAGKGPSLSIPEGAKPSLYQRMRKLVSADSLTAMITGTLMLALLANSYELLCTAGFPMIFTRLLTLNDLSTTAYYSYLAVYCLVYVIPLLIIVSLFVRTLGRRKLTAHEGGMLKLLSGLMMAGLGTALLIDPMLIGNLFITLGLVLGALFCTWLISRFGQR